jgi:hypothetical protein
MAKRISVKRIVNQTVHHRAQNLNFSWQPNRKGKEVNLGEKIDGTEESEPEVWVSDTGLDSGLVLYDPVGEVHRDPFVPQEIWAFGSGIGF